MDVAVLLAAGTGTALATGLGAVPVFFLGRHTEALRPALWGLAAGTMGVVSIVGLLAPRLTKRAWQMRRSESRSESPSCSRPSAT